MEKFFSVGVELITSKVTHCVAFSPQMNIQIKWINEWIDRQMRTFHSLFDVVTRWWGLIAATNKLNNFPLILLSTKGCCAKRYERELECTRENRMCFWACYTWDYALGLRMSSTGIFISMCLAKTTIKWREKGRESVKRLEVKNAFPIVRLF